MFRALVPLVAKGVFGETGALTDRDIQFYSQTIPNLKMNGDERIVMMAMLKRMAHNTLAETIKNQAMGGRDVSGFSDKLRELEESSRNEEERMLKTL